MDISELASSKLTGTTETFSPCIKNEVHYIGYCRTEQKMITFTYTWEICNFWDVYRTMLPLDTTATEPQPFNFRLKCDPNKHNLEFYILTELEYKGVCHIFLKNTDINIHQVMNVPSSTKENFLCNIPIILLLKKPTEYLPDGILTVCFECKWYNDISQKAMCTKITQSYDKLEVNSNNSVLDKNSFVTFAIGDERLYANKNVICEKSTVFQDMFKEDSKEVLITDVKYDILKLLLSYIQYSILPDFNMEDVKTLCDLFIAAHIYDVQDLKVLCELQLIKLVDTENCMELFKLAQPRDTKYLKDYIKKFIQVQPKCIFNPQVAKLVELNSESLLNIAKYTKMNITLSCDTKTNSNTVDLYKKRSEVPQNPTFVGQNMFGQSKFGSDIKFGSAQ